uniref:C3H1-type domain-containing protein n=1 Tax=Rhizochromulina marina TaxID=1034831 RepID=A0A7S2SXW6_9STRA
MFKKRSIKGKGIRRKRELEESQGGDEDGTQVVRDDERERKRVNAFSSAEEQTGMSGEGLRFADQSEGAQQHVYGGSATAESEIDTARDRDARALLEKSIRLQGDSESVDGKKVYRGQAGYKQFIEKKESQIGGNKHTGTQGPIRAPAFFRATCRFDYQPDICKDYKDTGFCGFGDSCKFMHDRGNYKTGWQLEKEWEEKQAKRKQLLAMGLDPDGTEDDEEKQLRVNGEDDDLPFACFLCRGPFKEPVVTTCGHFFLPPVHRQELRVLTVVPSLHEEHCRHL